MRARRFSWNDCADSSIVGTILMVGIVVAAIPGLVAIQGAMRDTYDQGTEVSKQATEAAKAAVPVNDPKIQAAKDLKDELNAHAAAALAAANAVSVPDYQAEIDAIRAKTADITDKVECAEDYVEGVEPSDDCAEPGPWEVYDYWFDGEYTPWICKSYANLGTQRRCYVVE